MHDGSDWAVLLGVLALLGVAVYLLPVSIAASRSHPNTMAIAALNILLGWTMLGWIAALVWALTAVEKTNPSQGPKSLGAATRNCPFCAEPVLVAAIKCKHCGSDLKASPIAPLPVEHKARQLAVGVVVGALVICGGAFGLSQLWGGIAGSSGSQAAASSSPTFAELPTASQPAPGPSASSSASLPEPSAPIAVVPVQQAVAQPQTFSEGPTNPIQEPPLAERMERDCSTGANSLRQAFDRILGNAQTGVHVARIVNVQNRKAYGCEVIFDMTDGNQVRGLFAADSRTVHWTASASEPLAYEKLVMSRPLALSQSDEGQ